MQIKDMRPLLCAAAIAMLGFAPAAFAYLDPSTGSMILSAIVGIFATVGLALKTYWYKLKSLFRGSSEQQQDAASTADSSGKSESGVN